MAYVPVRFLKPLMELVAREEDRSPSAILRGTGISPKILRDTGSAVTFDQQVRFYERIAKVSTMAGTGFRSPSAQNFPDQGMMGALMVLAPTVGDAFHKLEQYADVVGAMVAYHMQKQGNRVYLGTRDKILLSPAAHRLVAEENLAVWKGAAIAIPGLEGFLEEIHLDYPEPRHGTLYHELFPEVTIRFGQSRVAAILSAGVLAHPVRTHNPDAFLKIEAACREQLARMRPTMKGLVEQYLAESGPAGWHANAIADDLGMSQKMLSRRLRTEATSTKQIVETWKYRFALTLMDQGKDDREIASQLDYANRSSFARAFRNWSGETPASYRRNSVTPRRSAG